MKIVATQSLTGNLIDGQTLSGQIVNTGKMEGNIHVSSVLGSGNIEYYTGTYEVEPSINSQTLATKNKTMTRDLTVTKIPYAEVTNLANGITVTIGPMEV